MGLQSYMYLISHGSYKTDDAGDVLLPWRMDNQLVVLIWVWCPRLILVHTDLQHNLDPFLSRVQAPQW